MYGNKIYYICIRIDVDGVLYILPAKIPRVGALTGLAVFPVAVLAEVRSPKSIAFPVDAMVIY